ncbi:MAG: asparaginase domain-containing protein [Acidobacteria bacterium]|nr:asparaginase domain-containing protein [Acidobacteriota bacterium]
MKRKINLLFVGRDFEEKKKVISAFLGERRGNWNSVFVEDLKGIFKILNRSDFDIVLFQDCGKKNSNIEQLKKIEEKFPDLPLIIFTAFKKDSDLDNLVQENKHSSITFSFKGTFKKSEMMNLERVIKETLEKSGKVENDEGVLITHGTDTLSWALAYLRYSLKGLKSNVAVTGSQIPLEGTFSPSDAIGNLRTAVYLLCNLKPPHLFAVFNNGKDVFSGRLTKFRKWDVEAFEGRLAAKVTHEGLKILRDDWGLITFKDQKLEKLHLLKTGGTIESKKSEKGGLAPKGDFVFDYIKSNLKDYFEKILKYELFSLDSSDLSFEEWEAISKKIEELGIAKCDLKFDKEVKPIFVNPLFTSKDYEKLFEMCGNAAVLLGYGAGNANTLDKSLRSILSPLKKAVKDGKSVAITSQVPLELYDAEYESGRKLIEAGGIPCGDLSFSDAQVKLSYILGHKKDLEAISKKEKVDYEVLLISCFLSGVVLTKNQSEELSKRLKKDKKGKIGLLNYDPFVSNSFEKGAQLVAVKIKNG